MVTVPLLKGEGHAMAERRDEQDQREEHLCQLGANWVSEQRDGDEAVKIDKPDSRIRNSKAIDYVARDSIGSIAVEHTKIEPFIGEFTDSRRTIGFFDGFSERFGAFPPNSRLVNDSYDARRSRWADWKECHQSA